VTRSPWGPQSPPRRASPGSAAARWPGDKP
jgi:hypothetical protein